MRTSLSELEEVVRGLKLQEKQLESAQLAASRALPAARPAYADSARQTEEDLFDEFEGSTSLSSTPAPAPTPAPAVAPIRETKKAFDRLRVPDSVVPAIQSPVVVPAVHLPPASSTLAAYAEFCSLAEEGSASAGSGSSAAEDGHSTDYWANPVETELANVCGVSSLDAQLLQAIGGNFYQVGKMDAACTALCAKPDTVPCAVTDVNVVCPVL